VTRAGHAFACLLAGTSAAACADGPGHGFATLEAATLHASFEAGAARDLDGAVLTNRGYIVRLDSLQLQVDRLTLEALEGGGGGTVLDPARPPPGYTLCHGGHCHAVDGRLVPYVEIEAELAGAGASFAAVVTLPLAASVSLVPASEHALRRFEPSEELPESTLRRLSLQASGIGILGSVGGAGIEDPGAPLSVDLATPISLSTGLALIVGREGPEVIQLDVRLSARGTLFDDLEFADLLGDQGISITDPESEPALDILGSFLRSEIESAFQEAKR